MLAFAYQHKTDSSSNVYQFDNSTGQVISLILQDPNPRTYGVCFSPDNCKVYFSYRFTQEIAQFDLSSLNPVTIQNSRAIVANVTGGQPSSLQLGPDGKIYVAKANSSSLGAINNPNLSGTASNYVNNAISLASNTCKFGLPNFVNEFINPNGVIMAGGEDTICNGDTIQLYASGGYTYNWSPSSSLNDPSSNSPLAFPSQNTTYTLIINDSTCFPDTFLFDITVKNSSYNSFSDTSICSGDTITFNAQVPVSNWTPMTGVVYSDSFQLIVAPQDTVEYFAITKNSNCKQIDTVGFNVYVENYQAKLIGDSTLCLGNTTNVTSNLNIAHWFPQKGILTSDSLSIKATPDSSITYYAVPSHKSCANVDTLQFNITVDYPFVNSFKDTTICLGDTVTISAQDPVYQWYPQIGVISASSSHLQTAPLDTVTYYAITDSSQCNSYDTVSFHVFTIPSEIELLGDSAICVGDTVQIKSNLKISHWLPQQWVISADSFSLTTVPDSSQIYEAIMAPGFCNAVDTVKFDISVHYPTVNAIGDTSICEGDTIAVSAEFPVVQWGPSNSILTSDSHHLVVAPDTTTLYYGITDSSFCSKKDTAFFEVRVYPLVSYLITDTSVCYGDTAFIYSNAAVANWYPQKWILSSDSFSMTALPDSLITYYANTAINKCVNEDTISINVNVHSNPTISTSKDTLICETDTVQIFATGGISYSWSPLYNMDNDTVHNPNVSPDSTTLYTVKVSNSFNCSASDSVHVFVDTVYQISTSSDTAICFRDSVQLSANVPNLQWFPVNGLSDPTIPNPWAPPSITTTYFAQPTGGVCIHDIYTVTISINSLPDVKVSNDTFLCQPDTIFLNATGGSTYSWYPTVGLNNTTVPNPAASPDSTIVYYIEGFSNAGCSGIDSVEIQVVPAVHMEGMDTSICKGESVFLTARSSFDVFHPFAFTDTSSGNIIGTPDSSIEYYGIKNRGQCPADTTYFEVSVNLPPLVVAENDTTIDSLSGVQLNGSTNASSYYWQPSNYLSCSNCLSPIASPLSNTIFYFIGEKDGCTAIDSVQVFVRADCGEFFIPDAFTPNNDGLNDYLGPMITEGPLKLEHFRVYNRWGELLFETDEINNHWDGVYKREEQPMETYVYYIIGSCNGQPIEKKGNFLLIR